jgi:regulator of sirC expression with transglutaminase-like and TPR domain
MKYWTEMDATDIKAAKENPHSLTESRKSALITLLTDEDPSVYQTIRTTILDYGQDAVEWLQPYTVSSDPILRRRSTEIVQFLARQVADNRFLSFCLKQGEALDLEQGAWLLAETHYPNIHVPAYQAMFDGYAGVLRERIEGIVTVDKIVAEINGFIFKELGFSGDEQNYYDPENSYLNRIIDRRKGNPIGLCLLLILLARRVKLPITGIGMPGHFLCRYQSSTTEIFIDAFNQGRILTKAECIKYLLQSGHGYLDGYLAPVSPRRILLRICANLHQIYVDLEQGKEAARFQHYIVALSK